MPRSTQVPDVPLSGSGTGLSPALAELSSSLPLPTHGSLAPALQPRKDESLRFGLFPLRSPLLRESRLISFPSGTEMFHFPELAPFKLCIHLTVTGHDSCRVSPFRHPRIIGCLAPPRGLSQLTASFFAFRRQGIHPMLLSTCFARKKLPSFPIQLSMSRPLRVRQAHAWVTYPNSLEYPFKHGLSVFVVGLDRLELSTSRLSGVRSNHLSYRPSSGFSLALVELDGFEPTTPGLQSRCSPS